MAPGNHTELLFLLCFASHVNTRWDVFIFLQMLLKQNKEMHLQGKEILVDVVRKNVQVET